MEVTRRYWTAMAVGVLVGLWAIVLEQPVLLVSAALIGVWVVTRQYQFVTEAAATLAGATVTQTVDRTRVTAEETVLATLTVELPEPPDGQVEIVPAPPTGCVADPDRCTIATPDTETETVFDIQWPIAGQFSFAQPQVTITDSLGLFTETYHTGTAPEVTVEPRAPREIHVGEGGNRIAAGFGAHDAGRSGSGLKPAELRKYVPGDTTDQIDWNATARLNEPYVREFEAETDLETLLVVDLRAKMATGHESETKLDFARQVALALAETAERLGDPLGLYTVGDEGLTSTLAPSTDERQYRTITDRLRALTVTDDPQRQDTDPNDPVQARRTAAALDGETPFEIAFSPFFSATETYVERLGEKPLFGAIRAADIRLDGTVRTVILTDDAHRTELREAIKLARSGSGEVAVFLTPTMLYTTDTLSDIDESYRAYADFESFRRELAALPRVSAFEVGPRDRLSTILAAGRQREVGHQ